MHLFPAEVFYFLQKVVQLIRTAYGNDSPWVNKGISPGPGGTTFSSIPPPPIQFSGATSMNAG